MTREKVGAWKKPVAYINNFFMIYANYVGYEIIKLLTFCCDIFGYEYERKFLEWKLMILKGCEKLPTRVFLMIDYAKFIHVFWGLVHFSLQFKLESPSVYPKHLIFCQILSKNGILGSEYHISSLKAFRERINNYQDFHPPLQSSTSTLVVSLNILISP